MTSRRSVGGAGAAARHVVITGASSGIGAALARAFAATGASLTLVARRRELLEQLAAELGVRTHVVAADLLEHATDWIGAAEDELGPIDILVNNASSVVAGPFVEIDPAREHDVLALDLAVPLTLMRTVLPRMLARKSGTIVNIASTGALAPNPGMVSYCAAKAGLAAASESLRGELRGSGVGIVTVYPGPTRTDMLARAYASYPASRAIRMLPTGTPSALAESIVHAIRRGRPRVIYPRRYIAFRYLAPLVRWLLDRLSPRPLPAG